VCWIASFPISLQMENTDAHVCTHTHMCMVGARLHLLGCPRCVSSLISWLLPLPLQTQGGRQGNGSDLGKPVVISES
jgi:hypothetical protein